MNVADHHQTPTNQNIYLQEAGEEVAKLGRSCRRDRERPVGKA